MANSEVSIKLRDALRELEAENQTDNRCRALSLAITKIEEAIHWLDSDPKTVGI